MQSIVILNFCIFLQFYSLIKYIYSNIVPIFMGFSQIKAIIESIQIIKFRLKIYPQKLKKPAEITYTEIPTGHKIIYTFLQ